MFPISPSRGLLAAAFATALLAAPSAEGQSTVTGSLNVDGANRTYRLRVPAGADTGPARPLILSLHGFTQNAANQESQTDMNAVADTAGFYVAYPNGSTVLLFLQGWDDDLSDPGNGDIAFLDALITDLAANYNIDENKVYATGFSAGGGMSVALACALGDRIKGIAPVAAAINPANAGFCSPPSRQPLLQIHGTADAVVPIEGAAGTIFYPATAPAVAFFRAWIGGQGCAAPVFSNVPDTDPGDGSTVTQVDLGGCSAGRAHRFYRVNGGDHSVPGPGGANKDLHSSSEIWRFFRAQGGAFAAPPALSRERAGADVWPNPANAAATFRSGTDGPWRARLIDAAGRDAVVLQGSGAQGTLDLGGLPEGLYTLAVNGRTTRLAVTR